MQREPGEEKTCRGGDRGGRGRGGTKTRVKKGVPRKERMNGRMKKLFWISYKRPAGIERLQLFSACRLLIITRACMCTQLL